MPLTAEQLQELRTLLHEHGQTAWAAKEGDKSADLGEAEQAIIDFIETNFVIKAKPPKYIPDSRYNE